MKLLPVQSLFLLSVRLQLSDVEKAELKDLITEIKDWNELVRWAIARQAGPFLYKKLSELQVQLPDFALQAFKQSWLKTLSRNMVLIAHFSEVMTALNDVGISVIAMKGIYLSEWLYTEVGLRQFSDIDLLVKPEDGERALSVMREMGYQQAKSELPEDIQLKLLPAHYPAMIKNGVSVEIHTRLHSRVTDYEIDIPSLWEASRTMEIHNVSTGVFCTEHLLLTLIQHLDKHLRSGKFQFTGFFDIGNLLDLKWQDIDIAGLIADAKAWKMEALLYDYCVLTEKYFGISLPGLKAVAGNSYQELETLFLRGLSMKKMTPVTPVNNLKTIGYFDTPGQKIKYILQMVFPPRRYMMQRYQLTNHILVFLYYPYRWIMQVYTALVGIWK